MGPRGGLLREVNNYYVYKDIVNEERDAEKPSGRV